MNEEICKYRKELEKELKGLRSEHRELLNKFNNGLEITKEESARINEINHLIKEITSKLEVFKKYDSFSNIKSSLDIIVGNYEVDVKNKNINNIINKLKTIKAMQKANLKNGLNLNDKELKNLHNLFSELNQYLNDLYGAFNIAKRENQDTTKLEAKIKELSNKLDKIDEYLRHYNYDTDRVENMLTTVSSTGLTSTERENEFKEFVEEIDIFGEKTLEELKNIKYNVHSTDEEYDEFFDIDGAQVANYEEAREEKTKKELEENKTRSTLEKIAAGALIVALLAGAGYLIHKEIKNNKNTNNNPDDLNNEPVIEQKYIGEYKNDYETAMNIYTIPNDKAIDYVNRAYEISKTGFFYDVTINEIVDVLMAIDNRELHTTENASLAQLFNTSFNRVTDHFLFGKVTEEDIRKIDAIPYFAPEGTDLDKFLTEYAELVKNIITNPDSTKAKNNMYEFLVTFSTSLNGFANTDETLETKPTFIFAELFKDNTVNTNAQVNDYFDWYTAYNSFIAPLYPVCCPIYENYKQEDLEKYEADFAKYEALQSIMLSALEDPQIQEINGESLSLGGN